MIRLLLSLLSLPIHFGYWVKENGGKGLIVAGIVFVCLLIGILALQNAIRTNTGTASYSEQLLTPGPSRAEAPYKVVTDTRVYYAFIAVSNKETGTVTMTNYYELSYNEWKKTEGILILDENFGSITVTKRSLHE